MVDDGAPIDCGPFEIVVTCWLRFELLLVFGSNRTFVANVRANECILSSSIRSSAVAVDATLVLATADTFSTDGFSSTNDVSLSHSSDTIALNSLV